MEINTLMDREERSGPRGLSDELARLYAGDLRFPAPPDGRPYVIGNFVATLDGVVSYRLPGKSGGSPISGSDEADQFIMGLLRASADAVIVGSGTFHDTSPRHIWTGDYVYPAAKDLYSQYRRQILNKPEYPLHVIVSGRGKMDLGRAVFHTPGLRTLIFTTEEGRDHLHASGAASLPLTEIKVLKEEGPLLRPIRIVPMLREEFQVGLLLHEGGPALFGSFLADGVVDELFLTIAPQIAGRGGGAERPGLVSGVAYAPEGAPWLSLISLKQRGDHLYFRYRSGSRVTDG